MIYCALKKFNIVLLILFLSSCAKINVVEIDQDGDGDSSGHSVTLDITGGGSNYYIKQSGVKDNVVDGTFSGDEHDVDITQSD